MKKALTILLAVLLVVTAVLTLTACSPCKQGNHDWNDGKVTTDPTCEADGVKRVTCNRCGESDDIPVPAPGHNYGTLHAETDTTIAYYQCSVCHKYFNASKQEVTSITKTPGGDEYYTVNFTIDTTKGHVTNPIGGDMESSYLSGTTVEFKVVAEDGYAVSEVKNGSATLTANNDGVYSFTVTGETTITVTFTTTGGGNTDDEYYTVNFTIDSTKGRVTNTTGGDMESSYQSGATVQFKVVVTADNYEVDEVKNGSTTLTANNDGVYSFTVTGETTITVTFKSTGSTTPGGHTTHEYDKYSQTCECGKVNPEYLTETTDSQWKLVTNVSELTDGDEIILVGKKDNDYYALGTTQNNNNRSATSVPVPTSNVIATIGDDVQVITLGKSGNNFTFYVGNGYLYAAGSGSNNYLRTQTTNNTNGEWTITIDADGLATITAQGSSANKLLQFNSNNTLFSCYASATQKLVQIYKQYGGGTHTADPSEEPVVNAATCTDNGSVSFKCTVAGCNENHTVTITSPGHDHQQSGTKEPTCTEAGKIVYTCTKCDDTYEVDDNAPATGHSWVVDTTKGNQDPTDGWTWNVANGEGTATVHLKCSVEGCNATHDTDPYTVTADDYDETVAPKCDAKGTGTYTVTINYEGTDFNGIYEEEIDEIPHKYEEGNYGHDGDNHWLLCDYECGTKDVDSEAPHAYTKLESDKATDEKHTYSCVCGATQETEHVYTNYVKVDEDNHKSNCDTCDYLYTTTHTYSDTAIEIEGNTVNHKYDCTATGCDAYKMEAHNYETGDEPNTCKCGLVDPSVCQHNGQDWIKEVLAAEATCTTDEVIHHWYCENCGQVFSDSEGTQKEDDSYTQTGTKATGHRWALAEENAWAWATDGSAVTLNLKCANCIETNSIVIDPEYITPGETKAAECEVAGYNKFTVSVASEGLLEGHTKHEADQWADSVTETLTNEYTQNIDAKQHNYEEAWTPDGEGKHYHVCQNGCGTHGSETECTSFTWKADGDNCKHTCDDCGYAQTTQGHTKVWEALQDEDGHHEVCSNCGKETSGKEAHDYEYTKTEGTHTAHCETCGNDVTGLAHKYEGAYVNDDERQEHYQSCVCGDKEYNEHNWTDGTPTKIDGNALQHQVACADGCSATKLVDHVFTDGKACACGEEYCIVENDNTFNLDISKLGLTNSYDKVGTNIDVNGIKFSYTGLYANSGNIQTNNGKNSTLWNTSAFAGNITKVTIAFTANSNGTLKLRFSNDSNNFTDGNDVVRNLTASGSVDAPVGYKYVEISYGSGTGMLVISSITIKYSTISENHNWVEYHELDEEPTCTEAGKIGQICSKCETTRTITGESATGHTWEIDKTVGAKGDGWTWNATADGATATLALKCQDCNTKHVADAQVEVDDEESYDATCLATGLITYTATVNYGNIVNEQSETTVTLTTLEHNIDDDMHFTDETGHYEWCTNGDGHMNGEKIPHELVYIDLGEEDGHYVGCQYCDYEIESEEHKWSEESYNVDDNDHEYRCTAPGCGATKKEAHDYTEEQPTCSKCKAQKHVHNYDESEWVTDSKGHWYKCTTSNDCTAQGSYAEHTYNLKKIDKDGTDHWYLCDVCDYADTEHKQSHNGNGYEQIEDDNRYHKVYCTVCEEVTNAQAEHVYAADNFEGDYDDNGDGTHTAICKACGAFAQHTTKYTVSSTNNLYHNMTCEVAGCNYSESVEHNLSYAYADGTQHHVTCSKCNYSADQDHEQDNYQKISNTQHEKYCSICKTAIDDPVAHSYSTSENDYEFAGDKHTTTCTTCHETVEHANVVGDSLDDKYHALTCNIDGCKFDGSEEHDYESGEEENTCACNAVKPNYVNKTVTLTAEDLGLSGSYSTGTKDVVNGSETFTFAWERLSKQASIQFEKSTGLLWNTTPLGIRIVSIEIDAKTINSNKPTISFGTSVKPTGNPQNISSTGTSKFTPSEGTDYQYFMIAATANAANLNSIKITYVTIGDGTESNKCDNDDCDCDNCDGTDCKCGESTVTPPTGGGTVEVSTFSATNGKLDDYVSYTTKQNDGTTAPAISSNKIRLYQPSSGKTDGGSITITVSGGMKIKSIIIGTGQATTIAYQIGSGSIVAAGDLAQNGQYPLDVNDTSVTFICRGKSSSNRFDINYIKVIYE